jgi:hypothetical protein
MRGGAVKFEAVGFLRGYAVPLVRKADPTTTFSASPKSWRYLTSQLT